MTLSDKEFVHRLNEITEANMHNDQFGVSKLSQEMGMSRSNLHRKVKKIFNSSISQFICHTRLNKAIEILKKNESCSISDIAYKCGFHSVTYFDKCFHDHIGFPPGDVRKQLHAETELKLSN